MTNELRGIVIVVTVFVQISQPERTDILVDRSVVQNNTADRIEFIKVCTETEIDVITFRAAFAFPFVGLSMRIRNKQTGTVI